jgi:hypothetical protein
MEDKKEIKNEENIKNLQSGCGCGSRRNSIQAEEIKKTKEKIKRKKTFL